jgi:hypothetical protein
MGLPDPHPSLPDYPVVPHPLSWEGKPGYSDFIRVYLEYDVYVVSCRVGNDRPMCPGILPLPVKILKNGGLRYRSQWFKAPFLF